MLYPIQRQIRANEARDRNSPKTGKKITKIPAEEIPRTAINVIGVHLDVRHLSLYHKNHCHYLQGL